MQDNTLYISKSFKAVRSYPILLGLYLISTLFNFSSYFLGLPKYFELIRIAALFFQIAYIFSLPYFFSLIFQKKTASLSLQLIFKKTWETAKRIKLPLLFALFAVIQLLALVESTNTPSSVKPTAFWQTITTSTTPISTPILIISLVLVFFSKFLFSFIAVMYTFKNIGLWESLSQSISYSRKNLNFALLMGVISVLASSTVMLFAEIPILKIILSMFVVSPISFILEAAATMYYLEKSSHLKN